MSDEAEFRAPLHPLVAELDRKVAAARWTSFVPQFLGPELCRTMRALLASDEALPYVTGEAKDLLRPRRDELGALLREGVDTLVGPGQVAWWTFAGGRINLTLRYGLRALMDWDVAADNLSVRAEADSLLPGEWQAALGALAREETWTGLMPRIRELLPDFRLSKFQRALPEWAQREMVEGYLLDIEGAVRTAREAGAAVAADV